MTFVISKDISSHGRVGSLPSADRFLMGPIFEELLVSLEEPFKIELSRFPTLLDRTSRWLGATAVIGSERQAKLRVISRISHELGVFGSFRARSWFTKAQCLASSTVANGLWHERE